jgi:hypothetical protein
MNRYEQAYALSWLLLGILICTQARSLGLWVPDGPGSGLVPFLAGWTMGACGVLLFFLERAKGGPGKEFQGGYWKHPHAWKRILLVLAGFFFMAFFMPILGFLPTSILVMFFLIQVVERQNQLKVLLITLLTCIPLYVLLNPVFHIHLPKGILPF